MSPTRVKLTVGATVILAAFGYLFLSGMEASQVYYLTVDEYHQQAATMDPGKPFRVSGRVHPGSVERSDTGLDLRFTVYDPDATADVPMLAVAYHGVVPDTFMESSEVVVEGAMEGEVFAAHTLMAKCPSKYEGLTDEDARREAHESEGLTDLKFQQPAPEL